MGWEMEGLDEAQKKQWQENENARIASEVTEDFYRRREERRAVENCWILNLNFYSGNQYCDVTPMGLVGDDPQFYWQSRRVFNHIAPTVDSRIAKLEKMKPELTVRAFSDEDGDVKAAMLATGVLRYVQDRVGLKSIASRVTTWSEICGCAFFKVNWNSTGGRQVAVDEENRPVYEGEVEISVVPPFEIFPDRLDAEDLDGLRSIIHARAVPVSYIQERFGVALAGRTVSGLTGYTEPSTHRLPEEILGINFTAVKDAEILIERYTMPTADAPQGKLEIVAGGKLLYAAELPFINGERNERGFPFVKQDCMRMPGTFFGASVIDRMIPVQRAYNTVRNRKHEFLNRLSMGILTVEDGSVDADALEEDGLLPGKILVYRQGGKPPEILDCGSMPSEFKDEEEWLEKEFSLVSGISDLFQNSTPARVTSATGLQLLLSQDESRLTASVVNIERALKEVGRQILRLYRQFAGTARLMTLTGENKKTQLYYFNASSLDVNDLQFESKEAVSPEEKKATLLQLYQAGLLTDEDGKLSKENKSRILEAFGFGSYENAKDISAMHTAKASEENIDMKSEDRAVDDYDDHALHILEHTRYLLGADFKRSRNQEEIKKRISAHIRAHKEMAKE
ncbi:MAG: hypothetical protein E7371_00405 [Clostridiales bacterium]|nr:hypothetical protein [Clostridiales bacterium]